MFGSKKQGNKTSASSMVAKNVQVVEFGEDYKVEVNNSMYDFLAKKSMFGPKVKIVSFGGKYKVKFV